MPALNGEITRHTKARPCPICGGGDQDARGQGTRCFGFISGKWIHCSREEHAGKARYLEKSRTYLHVAKGPCPCGKEHAPGGPAINPRNARAHVYKYRDQEGMVVFEVVRTKNPKGFYQRRPGPNGKPINGLGGVTPVLYNLPVLKTADPSVTVWVCEGEKDADRLGSHDLVATTNPMGAGKWRDEYAEVLRGRPVAILPDNDEPGRQHAREVAQSLQGKAVSVKVVELPGLPEKGDVSDWLDAGGTVGRLRELLRETAEWAPPATPEFVPVSSTNGDAGQNGAPLANGDAGGSATRPSHTLPFRDCSEADLGIIRAESVVMTPIEWLWLYRFAAGEMALLAGDGGLGKSSLLLAIAAIITRGSQWPDKSGLAPVGSVIIVSAEDSRETTLKPRLVALGADLGHVYFVTARVKMPPRPGEDSVVNVQQSLQDRAYWKEVFSRIPHLKMMIIDPIPSYLGRGVNDAKNSELRSVLEPFLDDVTRPAGVALVANTHLNKNVDSSTPVHRITGNTAYGNLPRNVHFVIRDRDNPNRRLFKQAKCNNAPDDLSALAFSIEKAMVPSATGLDIETSYPVFEAEPVHVDLQEAMGKKGHGHRGPSPQRTLEVAVWLLDYLRQEGQPVRVRHVFEAAGAKGYVGELKDEKGRLRWSGGRTLYTAKERVPELPEPNRGWTIEAYPDPDGGGQVWRAVRQEKETGHDVPF